jgi:hypothetical protein
MSSTTVKLPLAVVAGFQRATLGPVVMCQPGGMETNSSLVLSAPARSNRTFQPSGRWAVTELGTSASTSAIPNSMLRMRTSV